MGREFQGLRILTPQREHTQRCVRCLQTERRRLATLPEVRACLRDDDHGAFVTDPKHWPKNQECYYTENKKFERQFWDRSRPDRFNREESNTQGGHKPQSILEIEDPGENEEDFEPWPYWESFYWHERRASIGNTRIGGPTT